MNDHRRILETVTKQIIFIRTRTHGTFIVLHNKSVNIYSDWEKAFYFRKQLLTVVK